MDLGSQRIKRISIADEVVKRLQNQITSGKMAVGDKLPTESELQDALGVGRSTIREALRVLQAMGLIEMKSGRGAFVRNVSVSSIEDWVVKNEERLKDMMNVRRAMETLAVELAIENGTPDQLERVAQAQQGFLEACEEKNAVKLAQFDEEFHNAILAASHNVYLVKLSKMFSESLRSFRNHTFAHEKLAARAAEPHRKILAAIQSGNKKKAMEAMRHHLDLSLEDLHAVAPQAFGKKKDIAK